LLKNRKMMLKRSLIIVLCILCFCSFTKPETWGKTGHRSTAQIANDYLKNRTKRKIKKLLDGKSLALVSTYADEIKSDPSMKEYSKWHYINIPEGKRYVEVKDEMGPNLISALQNCVKKLKDDSTPKTKKRFYLKMLVHLVGDLHQPLHLGHEKNRGGNDIELEWFGEETNLHRVWDSNMIDSYQMSYTELAINQKDISRRERKKMQEGDFVAWMKQTQKLTKKVYNSAEDGDRLYYDYMEEWFPTVHLQLQKGGVRLAKVLNSVF